FSIFRPPLTSTLFPYTTLFRSDRARRAADRHARIPVARVAAAGPGRGDPRGGNPVSGGRAAAGLVGGDYCAARACRARLPGDPRSEEHTSELQSRRDLVCRLLL